MVNECGKKVVGFFRSPARAICDYDALRLAVGKIGRDALQRIGNATFEAPLRLEIAHFVVAGDDYCLAATIDCSLQHFAITSFPTVTLQVLIDP